MVSNFDVRAIYSLGLTGTKYYTDGDRGTCVWTTCPR